MNSREKRDLIVAGVVLVAVAVAVVYSTRPVVVPEGGDVYGVVLRRKSGEKVRMGIRANERATALMMANRIQHWIDTSTVEPEEGQYIPQEVLYGSEEERNAARKHWETEKSEVPAATDTGRADQKAD